MTRPFPITFSDTLRDVSKEHCIVHQIVQTHKAEIAKLLEQTRPSVDDNFKSTPICETPQGEKLTLDNLETIYAKHYPEWNKKFQCFPEGPMFYDKLFTVQPYTRAKDIENRTKELKMKITPFPGELNTTQASQYIMESLQPIITDLKLSDNKHVKGIFPKLLGKIEGKSKEWEDKTQSEVMEILHDVQNEIFDMILENDKIYKLYQMR